jgi:Single-strand binding protein family
MAKGINKSLLLGHVGKDPEIRSTAGGTIVAAFTFATSDRQKDSQGNWTDKTEWHNLVAFNRTAEIVRDYVKKGHPALHRWQDPDAFMGRQGIGTEEVPHGDPCQRVDAVGRSRRIGELHLQQWRRLLP